MSAKPRAGRIARTDTDGLNSEKVSEPGQCTRCGAPAAGLDAQTGESLCADCAARRDAQTPTVHQARCPECTRLWPARRLKAAAEGDASIHNSLVHDGEDVASVTEVQP